nr:PREDICTED: putative olfactory receptor 13C6 [Lepisosteus oculatus]
MSTTNYTGSSITEFIIIGFPGLQDQGSKTILFFVFLVVYLIIVLGNLLIILIFVFDKSLHTPMYVLICNLAFLDISIPSITLPKMLARFMFDSSIISFEACFAQMFLFMSLGIAEGFLLTVMAYDRYLAICNPLHYPSKMTNSLAIKHVLTTTHVLWCWVGGFLAKTIPTILAVRLPFCGPDKILHCWCDHFSILRLACANIVINSILGLTIALSVLFIPLFLILLSSACIYISYRVPGTAVDLRIMAAVFQNVIPPLVNPIIYCLRMKEIRTSLVKN